MDKQLIPYLPNPFLKYLEDYEKKTLLDTTFLNGVNTPNIQEGEIIICAKALNILRICAHQYDFIPMYGDTEIDSSISSTTVTTTSYDEN